MAHYQIKRWDTGDVIYEGEAETLKDLVNTAVKDGKDLYRASLDGARLDGASLVGARLVGARLVGASLVGARLVGASLDGASLDHARLDGASLDGASLDHARLDGASLDHARLDGASLDRARLRKGEILGLISLSGLYKYHITAYVLKDGLIPCVKMGCLDKTRAEWQAIGIQDSNKSEFPNDGSYTSMQRIRAFEYAMGEALALRDKIKMKMDAKP